MPPIGNKNSKRNVKNYAIAPWFDWKEEDRADRAIKFIEEYLVLPKGYGAGQRVRLAEFQKAWIRSILADGIKSAVLSVPRGQGKSTLLAGLAVWALFDTDPLAGQPIIPVIAKVVRQAEKAVYEVAVSMIEAEPELETRSLRYNANGQMRTLVPYNKGILFAIASDVDGLQGLDISFAVCDELGFQSIESWSALILATSKRPRSLVVGIGTPAPDFDNALFFLRKRVKEGANIPGFVFTEYAADEGCRIDDVEQWHKANPALAEGFLNLDAIYMELGATTEAQFRIFRLNQWVMGNDCWLGTEGKAVWDAIEEPYEFELGAPTWVGVDVGLFKDSTAVAAVQKRPDGRLHVKVKVWMPAKETPVDMIEVMEYLRGLADKYKVGAISYDPRFFEYPAIKLHDEGLPMINIPQTPARMVPIIGNTYERIKNKQITHDDDAVFSTHVLNAIPKVQENGFTLQKSKSRGKIDACIAMSLAVDRAVFEPPPRPPVFVL